MRVFARPGAWLGLGLAGATLAAAAAQTLVVEGEALARRASVNGGAASVQAMEPFGRGWSGDAQLFWAGGAIGAVLDLPIDVPATAVYAVEVSLTLGLDRIMLRPLAAVPAAAEPSPALPTSAWASSARARAVDRGTARRARPATSPRGTA